MKKEKSYLKATGLYTIGNVFNKAISLLLLPIFTRLLSTESYGVVSTYNSWVSLATIIIGLQLYLTLRSAFSEYADRLYSYISSIDTLIALYFTFFSTTTIIVCIFCFESIPLILVVFCLIHAFMHSIINVELQRQMMALEYVKRTLLLSIPNLIAALLGIVLIVMWPETDYMGRICSWVAVYVIIGTFFFISHLKKGREYFNLKYWKYGISYSFPLIFHGLSGEALNSVDKTMLTSLRTASETGIYSVSYTMGMALKIITSSVESVWVPWFTKKIQENNKMEINSVARLYLISISLICVAAMLCLPEVLKAFADRPYWDGVYVIPPIVLASFIVFLYSLSVDVEYYYKATKGIAINTAIAAVANLTLNYIFIPKYGAMAAAYTTVVSYAISFIIHYSTARKLDRELFPIYIYLAPITIAFFGTVLTYLTIEYWLIRWAIACAIMLIMVVVGIIKFDIINTLRH